MEENKKEDRQHLRFISIHVGTMLGIYWIAKFCLFPVGVAYPIFMPVFILLTLLSPILVYLMARAYRDRASNGVMSFFHGLLFCFLTYMYASMLVSVAHFVYFQFIDNGFIMDTYTSMLDSLAQEMNNDSASMDQLKSALDSMKALTPAQLTLELFSQNLFYSIILSILTALLLRKR